MESTWKISEEPKGRSPWGTIDHATELAPGIWSVSTPGHGGLKLSRERNAAMPDYMRAAGGWYEEDCQWSLVALVFPGPFIELRPWQKEGDESHYVAALATARDWHATEYERFFGVTLSPAESLQRREQAFARDNASNYLVLAAWGDWAIFVPPGKVGVLASLGGKRETGTPKKWFLVDAADYTGGNFVADLSRDIEIPEPVESDKAPRAKAA